HPVFQRALHQAIERMRDELTGEARRRILAEEVEHREHIRQLEQEESDHRKALDQLRGVTQQAAAALELIRQTKDSLTPGVSPIDGQIGGQGGAPGGDWAPAASDETTTGGVRALKSPSQAVEHLGNNLERLGLRPVSARLLARTGFAAASLGQMVFFRGSLALPVAETVACTLAGQHTNRLTLTGPRTAPLDLTETDPETAAAALVLDGINRLDLGAWGADLLRLLRDRALGLAGWPPTPVILATLAEGRRVPRVGVEAAGGGAAAPAADALLRPGGPACGVDARAGSEGGGGPGAVAAECRTWAWDVPWCPAETKDLVEIIEDLSPLPHRL